MAASATGFPRAARSNWTVANDTVCDRIERFLEFQMNQFSSSGSRFTQTYRVPGKIEGNRWEHIFYRADIYDTSVASIFFIERGNLKAATDLVDAICNAMLHDPVGDGRVIAATHANAHLLANDWSFTTSTFPGAGAADVGNLSWAGIAMTRLHNALTSQDCNYGSKYLDYAITAGNWIRSNTHVDDKLGGFSGGYEDGGAKRGWRSVEHNTDVFVFFTNLFNLTGDSKWKKGAQSAAKFVHACRLGDEWGLRYCAGTRGYSQNLNVFVVPTDCQTWTSLASVDPASNSGCLQFMLKHMRTQSAGFAGVLFSRTGREVQNENTASAAMALFLNDQSEEAQTLYDSLERQIASAPNSDGFGIVATPAAECFTGDDLGWSYFNWPHTAASAWTGLAFLVKEGKFSANPFATIG